MNRPGSRGRGFRGGQDQAVGGTLSGDLGKAPAIPNQRYLRSTGRNAWQQIELEACDGDQYNEPQEHDGFDEERPEDYLGPEWHADVQDEDEFGARHPPHQEEGKL